MNVKKPNSYCLGTQRKNRINRHKLRKRTLEFGTWNVQGISNKQIEVVSELRNKGVDLAVLTETKKKGQGSQSFKDYDLFYSGVSKDQRARQGVAILVRKRLRKCISTWEAIDQRMIRMNLNLHGHKITVLGVYGVNDDASVSAKDQFFEQLNDEIVKIGDTREVIVMGDLNSRIGHRLSSKVVGPFGEETVNDNGNRIIDLCDQNELRILNGFFQHRDIHKFTWVQPTRGLRSVIDYAITRQTTSMKVQQVKVCRGLSCGSDHYFLKVEIAFPVKGDHSEPNLQQREQEVVVRQVKYNINSLQQESVKGLYRKRLDEKLSEGTFDSTE